MIKLAKTFQFLLLSIGFAGTAFADGWTSLATVTNVQVIGAQTDGSRIYVIPSVPVTTTCTSGGTHLRLDGSTQRGKYDMLLINIALATGKNITFNVVSCDDWGWPIIVDVQSFS